MRKKNVLVIVLTALIFLSVAVLGVSTVYRVNTVAVRAPVVSEMAKTEAEQLQEKLTAAYDKQSIFSANDELAKEIVSQFPYFNITGFEKNTPTVSWWKSRKRRNFTLALMRAVRIIF